MRAETCITYYNTDWCIFRESTDQRLIHLKYKIKSSPIKEVIT